MLENVFGPFGCSIQKIWILKLKPQTKSSLSQTKVEPFQTKEIVYHGICL